MSRPIKYRAWHKTEKKMYGPFTLGDLYGYEGEVNAVTLTHPYSSEGQSLVLCEHRGGSLFYPQLDTGNGLNPDIELLEYTGCTDKHGKDIFEGDILQINSHAPHSHELATVAWKHAAFFLGDELLLGEANFDAWEIIGNVHENQELARGAPDDKNGEQQ